MKRGTTGLALLCLLLSCSFAPRFPPYYASCALGINPPADDDRGPGLYIIAGADLKDIAALDAAGARSSRYLEDLCTGMASVRKPLLAAVEGPAVRMTPGNYFFFLLVFEIF